MFKKAPHRLKYKNKMKKYICNIYDDGQLISLIYKHKLIRKNAGRKLNRRHKYKFTLGRNKNGQN